MKTIITKKLLSNKNIQKNIKIRRGAVFKINTLNNNYKQEDEDFFSKMIIELANILLSKNIKASLVRIHLEYQDINIPKLKFSVNLIHPTNNYKKLLKYLLPVYKIKNNKENKVKKIGISCEKLINDKFNIQMIFGGKNEFKEL